MSGALIETEREVLSHGPAVLRARRIFLADDHAVVREGIRTLVDAQLDMEVVGVADNGEDAVRSIHALAQDSRLPDIVVMDISMPGWNGTRTTAEICQRWPSVQVLTLSMHEDRAYLRAILEAGAAGYVLKRSASAELLRAIRQIASGGTYLDPSLTTAVMNTLVRSGGSSVPKVGFAPLRGEIAGAPLSERENMVIRLIAQGYTNKEIAAQLKVSIKTVETYKARSMEKLEMDSRTDIVRYALAQGWLN